MRGRNSRPGSRGSLIAIVLAFVVAALAASPASATVTIGSADPFGPAPGGLVACTTDPCSHSQAVLPGRPVTSPVNGVVVRWSVRWGATPDTAALRVLDPQGDGAIFVSSSPPASILTDKESFAASLPIGVGDQIAVEDLGPGSPGGPRGTPNPGAVIDSWLDSPANGGFAEPTVSNNPPDTELLLNAEIEPSNDTRVDSITRNRKKGTAVAQVTVPNPGTLVVSSNLVAPKTLQAPGPGSGVLQVPLQPRKKARKRLKRKGKAVGSARFTYTPTFGTPKASVVQIPLRLKRKK
jgi:hypothetical protein